MTTAIQREALIEDVERFAHTMKVRVAIGSDAISLNKNGEAGIMESLSLHESFPNTQAGINAACGVLVRFQHMLRLARRS